MARVFTNNEAVEWLRLHESYPAIHEVSDMTQTTLKLNDQRRQPSERRLSHTNDTAPAKQAGRQIAKQRTELQQCVLTVLRSVGKPMTDDELAVHFVPDYDKGTIRKRRSELYQMQLVRKAGVGRSDRGKPMTQWEVV